MIPVPSSGGSGGLGGTRSGSDDSLPAGASRPVFTGGGGSASFRQNQRSTPSPTTRALEAAAERDELAQPGFRGMMEGYLSHVKRLENESPEDGEVRTSQQDLRTQLQDVTDWPRRAVVKLFLSTAAGPTSCSGLLIGRKTVLTAGHCLYNPAHGGDWWVTSVQVVPGMDGWYWPYGSAFSAEVAVAGNWNGTSQLDYDWGVVLLDRNIGDVTGYYGYWAPNNNSLDELDLQDGGLFAVMYSSYPAALAGGLSPIWSPGFVDCYTDYRIYTSVETSGASSGGVLYPGSGPHIDQAMAVQSGTSTNLWCLEPRARATRITSSVVSDLNGLRDDPSVPVINNNFGAWSRRDAGPATARPTAVAPFKGPLGGWDLFFRLDNHSIRNVTFDSVLGISSRNIAGDALGHVAAVSRYNRQIDVFARANTGIWYSAGQLCTKSYDSGFGWWPSLSDWVCFSDTLIVDAPSAVTTQSDRLHVFGRGANGRVLEKSWAGASGWAPVADLGGNTASPIAAVSRVPGLWDIFIRDAGTGQICTKARDSTRYYPSQTDWACMGSGSVIVTAPTVVSSGPNRLDVFGVTSAGSVIHMFWRGASWQGPVSLGVGPAVGPVAAVSRTANQVDIYVVGIDGGIYTKAHNGTSWWPGQTSWFTLGGTMLDVDVVSYNSSRLDVFARGRDLSIWQLSWNGSTWQ